MGYSVHPVMGTLIWSRWLTVISSTLSREYVTNSVPPKRKHHDIWKVEASVTYHELNSRSISLAMMAE